MNRFVYAAGAPRHVCGWIPDRPDPARDKLLKVPIFSRFSMPRHKTVRSKCAPVENQGTIGSCTAHGGTDAVEFLRIRAGLSYQALSPLYLYYMTRKLEGTPATEDSGAQIRNTMKVLSATGVCLETIWPYDASRYTEEPSEQAHADARRHKALFYYRCPNLMTIKMCIVQGYGIVGGFSCPESMFRHEIEQSGNIPYPGKREGFNGGHCVFFTGYDDDRQELEIKNSWSERWGRGGYGTIKYRMVDDGFADDFWTVRAASVE